MFAVWALKWIVAHSEKETLTPGIEIEENPVLGYGDCFMELIAKFPVSGIKIIAADHLEIFSGIC